MLKGLTILLRFFLFWLLFFSIDRIIFLLYFFKKLYGISFSEIGEIFLRGLRMDMSAAGYIAAVPIVIFTACLFIPSLRIPVKIPRLYTRFFIILFSLITIINFNIYREWGTKINYRALDFAVNSPREAFASSSSSPFFSSFLIFFILAGISFWLEKRIIDYRIPKITGISQKTLLIIPALILTFLAIRGGWQLSPINDSMAYFSQRPFFNHAATNTEWSLIRDVMNNKYADKNPYSYFKPEEAREITASLYEESSRTDPVQKILTAEKPNVVVIILESFTADVIESLGGEKGTAPAFEKLIQEGLLFNHIYASGERTDKGVTAILSAFPAQSGRSIMKQSSKQVKLPAISQEFRKNGYQTSFYYGGESEFTNMKSYLLNHGYQRIIDKHAFAEKDMNSKWGAYDEVVFRKQLADLQSEKQPFFSTLLTLTNHEPFEVPGEPHFSIDSDSDKFRNTSFYTDSCLAAYLLEAKKQDWYKNTLFIITADHGHRLPKNEYEIQDPHRFRIPLLFYGDVIKPEYRGKRIEKTGGQTDIAATLLFQLDMNTSRYPWSKNLLNPASKDFAFYSWNNGFGLVTPKQALAFDNIGHQIIYKRNNASPDSVNARILNCAKAYMQQVFQEYLDY